MAGPGISKETPAVSKETLRDRQSGCIYKLEAVPDVHQRVPKQ